MAGTAQNGHTSGELLLGRTTAYPEHYDPDILQGLPRSRQAWLGTRVEPFRGFDRWVAWEASWLNQRGRPQVGVAILDVPSDSPRLVESKSLKLFLNSLNSSRFGRVQDYAAVVERDVSAVLGAPVGVRVLDIREADALAIRPAPGVDLDVEDVDPPRHACDADLLRNDGDGVLTETVHSNLLRSLCPVTGQPDWGTLVVSYRGQPIHHGELLRYLISWRDHSGFHEETVERIYTDILDRCAPRELTVTGHYLRRGGIDITPVRSNGAVPQELVRLSRQ